MNPANAIAQKNRLALVAPSQGSAPLYLNPMPFMGPDGAKLDVAKWEAARQQQAVEAADMAANMVIGTKVDEGGWGCCVGGLLRVCLCVGVYGGARHTLGAKAHCGDRLW